MARYAANFDSAGHPHNARKTLMPSIAVILNNEQIVVTHTAANSIAGASKMCSKSTENTDALINALEHAHGQVGLGAAHVLFSTRGIGTRPKMAVAVPCGGNRRTEPLKLQVKPVSTFRSARDFEFLLDLRIHYDRLYLATERGAFALSVKDRGERRHSVVQPDVLHESYSYSLSTGLRAVAMSRQVRLIDYS